MNEYWKQQFLDDCAASEAAFKASYRKITNQADSRMRERTARQQHAAALRDLNRGPDDVVPDADDASVQRGMMR